MSSQATLGILLALTATACFQKNKEVTSATAKDTSSVKERTTTEGNLVVEVDLDGDGSPDIYNYFKQLDDEGRLLLRKEMDLNQDSRIDVWSFYTELGALEREEMDGDFDGNVDWIDHYQGGKRVLSEVDSEFDGQIDLWKFYENERVRRKERDSNGDGMVDYWEYLNDDGQVVKTGRDVDGDGQMDIRDDL